MEKAVASARTELARQVSTRIGTLQQQFTDEIGSDQAGDLNRFFAQIILQLTSVSLSGSRMVKQQSSPEGELQRVYVLVSMPADAAVRALAEAIRSNPPLFEILGRTSTFAGLIGQPLPPR